ncbi:ead/Ea22-like family protein [Klebsiella pneumoniae]|uniref:ead/Ea22-like family protein n=1 Tax=Klebsiella pneumoniae TaxID=573 RepID=UPI001B8A9E05|nr:ead/Ea22-like family protein [Klebsiella pneumoniae]MBR7371603.1 ead/Ea22-like family protein [Klebsiella pneumoniae]MBX8862071.1 ead/Ea22-like family protein [Klebsiella pneumoniae]
MTDITELAQSLKAAAEKAGIEQWVNNRGEVNTADYEVDGGMYIDHICDCEIVGTESPRAEFIALANPANILALVEALESETRICATWRKTAEANSEKLEKAQHVAAVDWEAAASLNVENQELKSRIAELESRTVKMPEPFKLAKSSSGLTYYFADDVDAALTDAGIKVEAE